MEEYLEIWTDDDCDTNINGSTSKNAMYPSGAKPFTENTSFFRFSLSFVMFCHIYNIPPITYYWTVQIILDHSYLVGKLTSSKIAETKVSGF
jgi:hypothetical protein